LSKLNFNQFLEKAFPVRNPFFRDDFGAGTNLIKYLAIRVSYILYRLGVKANQISLLSVVLSIPAFIIIYQATFQDQHIYKFLFGYILMGTVLFIDFVDGPLSKMNQYKYHTGDDIDNLPPDMATMGTLLIFGMLPNNIYFTALFWANIVFLFTYLRNTIKYIPDSKQWILKTICSRFSLLSVRVFVATIFPLFCILYIYNQELANLLSKTLIIFYVINSIIWISITLESKFIK
tara:strand:+ start:31116 stop:31817 length:702 start_codon:yes stop_codon:yes gene_type:complete